MGTRRLAVGKLTPNGTLRMTAPHGELAAVATAVAKFRAKGMEVTLTANPGTLNSRNGGCIDRGLRIIARKDNR